LSRLRLAALCLLAVVATASTCLAAGVRVHFFDRLDTGQISETLFITIIGPAWTRQVQISLNAEKSEAYQSVDLPEAAECVVFIRADTIVRMHGQQLRRSSAGMERLNLRGGETFELMVEWGVSPGVLGLRELVTERKSPEPVLPPVFPPLDDSELELVPPKKSGSFSNALDGKPALRRKQPARELGGWLLKPLLPSTPNK